MRNNVREHVVIDVIEELRPMTTGKNVSRTLTRVCHLCHLCHSNLTNLTDYDTTLTSEFSTLNTPTTKKNGLRQTMTELSNPQLIQGGIV